MKKTILLVSAGSLVLVALVIYLATSRPARTIQELSQAQFVEKVQSNLIDKVQVAYPPEPPLFLQQVRGTFFETDSSGRVQLEKGMRKESRFHASVRISDDLEKQLLANTNTSIIILNPAVQKLKNLVSQGR